MMRRREILVLLCGATIACPRAAVRAQRKAMPVIGFLHFGSPDGFAYQIDALRHGLAENGYVDGKNVAIETRWAEFFDIVGTNNDRLAAIKHYLAAIEAGVKMSTATLVENVRARLLLRRAHPLWIFDPIFGPEPPIPADIQREVDHERLVRALMTGETIKPREHPAGLNRDGKIGSHYR